MSLTGQWQFFSLSWVVLGIGYHRKLSLTGQWQFVAAQWTCLKQRIMHIYGHTTYGHMSLTTVNDKNLWTKPKKVSLTSVNDKKIVIDHGQWQKNCHWLKGIYIGRGANNQNGNLRCFFPWRGGSRVPHNYYEEWFF